MELVYFFDTFAFYELIKGNPRFIKYKQGITIITTKLNLMELYFGLLRDEGEEIADMYFDDLLQYCIEVDDDIYKEAARFRLQNYKRELSYIDCIGYISARKLGAKFLTGDKQFQHFDNVEFVT